MDHDQIKRSADGKGNYDDANEDTLRSMLCSFYNRKMLSVVILVWVNALIFFGLAVLSAVLFFRADQTRDQILYAALFIVFMEWCAVIKIFAWQTIHRNSIKRAIKRLEIRVAALQESLHTRFG